MGIDTRQRCTCLKRVLPDAAQEYIHKFEAEHVRLHMLLGIDHRGLEVMGMHSYGHREQLIEGVKEYLRAYLRAAETTTQISARH